ncbi:MAG TPA: hypothetical protein VID05_05725, partial [Acidimicrobiales bacterium]
RVDNMIENVRSAAAAGIAHGAGGLLVTDWGDMGHLQQPPVSDPGFATTAAFGWCVEAHAGLDADSLGALLDVHCYDDRAGETGRVVVDLGQACRMVAPEPPNMSALALPLLLPQWAVGTALTEGLTTADLLAVESMLDRCTTALGRARPQRGDAPVVIRELEATSALLALACHDARLRLAGDGTLASVAGADRDALAADLSGCISEHQRLWLERFRPGGLSDSTAWLEHLLACYRTGVTERSWFGPAG